MSSPLSFSDPHHNVTLTTSAKGLPAGQFEVCGFFNPNGFMGERVPCYRYRITERASYDATAKRIAKRYGNTVAGAEALFAALSSLSSV